jgi:hypothetical protein
LEIEVSPRQTGQKIKIVGLTSPFRFGEAPPTYRNSIVLAFEALGKALRA